MTFLNILAFLGATILVLLGVLIIAGGIYLTHLVRQERRLGRIEAEQAEAEQAPRPELVPYVPQPWRGFGNDDRDD